MNPYSPLLEGLVHQFSNEFHRRMETSGRIENGRYTFAHGGNAARVLPESAVTLPEISLCLPVPFSMVRRYIALCGGWPREHKHQKWYPATYVVFIAELFQHGSSHLLNKENVSLVCAVSQKDIILLTNEGLLVTQMTNRKLESERKVYTFESVALLMAKFYTDVQKRFYDAHMGFETGFEMVARGEPKDGVPRWYAATEFLQTLKLADGSRINPSRVHKFMHHLASEYGIQPSYTTSHKCPVYSLTQLQRIEDLLVDAGITTPISPAHF